MRRIEYPQNISLFENDYYNSISKQNEKKIDDFLLGIPLIPIPLTFKDLVTGGFEDLVDYHFLLEPYLKSKTPIEIKDFKKWFDYTTNQPAIADFFMSKRGEIELKTCFYCNIDFINSFSDYGEYKNELHFINMASIEELKIIFGDVKAHLIYNSVKIKRITDFNELKSVIGIGQRTISKLKAFDLKNLKKDKNHFTLDHFIPKSKFPYFALSLYNLIPSCYSCNSKFKGAMEFKDINNLKFLSPSSDLNSLLKKIEFKLYFNVPGIYFKKKIKNVNVLEDIRVDIENIGGIDEFDTYLDMFKLKGRYVYHKNESLKLIQLRKKYSDTEINEIAKISGRDINDIKSDIFGSVIFNVNERNEPFVKYKKDIAKQLRLIK
jgi:hypothetical protein